MRRVKCAFGELGTNTDRGKANRRTDACSLWSFANQLEARLLNAADADSFAHALDSSLPPPCLDSRFVGRSRKLLGSHSPTAAQLRPTGRTCQSSDGSGARAGGGGGPAQGAS